MPEKNAHGPQRTGASGSGALASTQRKAGASGGSASPFKLVSSEPPADVAEDLSGVAASHGIARGNAYVCCSGAEFVVPRWLIRGDELAHEFDRLEAAVRETDAQLRRLEADVRGKSGSEGAAIFEAQIEMLHDPMLRKEITSRCLRERVNVEAAVSDAVEKLVGAFLQIEDDMLRERAADLQDVACRLLARLLKRAIPGVDDLPPGSVVVAGELLPSLAVGFGQNRIAGLVAERGGTTSHALILARSLGLPAVICVDDATRRIRTGDPLIVDGFAGRVHVRPTARVVEEYQRKEAELAAARGVLAGLADLPSETADGVKVRLNANVGLASDAVAATNVRADGIGLFRTEFAFMVHADFPTEDQQVGLYRDVARFVAPRELVIRALDLGSDKLLPYFPQPAEPNPSLGYRGTRLLLGHPEILMPQLRAVLRLSATYPVSLLFPMIGGPDEFLAARRAVEHAKAELAAAHVAFNPGMKVGAMIETPAAALTVRWLAKQADFLSVGSTDLVQYLLATDRTSREVADYYQPLHPAVIQTLKAVIDAAREAGKQLSLCGEVAGNPTYTELLLGLGVRSFSVAPGQLLEVKRAVRSVTLVAAERLAARVLAAGTLVEVKACLAGMPGR